MQRYGKLDVEGNLSYAEPPLKLNGEYVLHPTAAQYAMLDFLPVIEDPPIEPPEEGYHWEPCGWEKRNGTICRLYEQVEDPPPPPRIFSKMKCVIALMNAGLWDTVKEYIETMGLYDLYLAAQDFREDNEYFRRGRDSLQASLHLTDAQVEEILAASIAD